MKQDLISRDMYCRFFWDIFSSICGFPPNEWDNQFPPPLPVEPPPHPLSSITHNLHPSETFPDMRTANHQSFIGIELTVWQRAMGIE